MRACHSQSPSRWGFTLIELLVVISIISVLAAMLLPAMSKAKWRLKMTGCASNQKQIGTSLLMYADDNDGFLPPYCADFAYSARAGSTGKSRLDYMWQKMTPYGLEGAIAQCPAGRGSKWKGSWMKNFNSRSDYFYVLVSGSYYKQNTYKPLRVSGVDNSSAKTIVWDTADDPWGTSYWANVHKKGSIGPAISQTRLSLDGHVELHNKTTKRLGLGY